MAGFAKNYNRHQTPNPNGTGCGLLFKIPKDTETAKEGILL